ncbi:MAG: hypothetical protein ACI9MB_001982 [Verrucomicrobiales bacterium]
MFGQDVPDPPLLINFSAPNDNWSKDQEKLLAYCQQKKLPIVFAWGQHGHQSSVAKYHPAARQFPWRSIRKNQAYPVFSNTSTDGRYAGFKNASGGDEAGQVGALFRWEAFADEAEVFQINLRMVTATELETTVDLPTSAETGVSLRRLQLFKALAGKSYRWTLSRGGEVLQSGETKADGAGLLTIEGLKISDRPAQLKISA